MVGRSELCNLKLLRQIVCNDPLAGLAHMLALLALVHALRVFKHRPLGSGAPQPGGCGLEDNRAITRLEISI